MKISCIIVTYNRLPLLQECIAAVKNQTQPVDSIYIIDNQSTDGTSDYLQTLKDDHSFIIVKLPENRGGAGGFSEGIRKAVMDGCDWVWVMDDDTIPTVNALEELVKGTTVSDLVGYVCSKVVWKDDMLHKMNIPDFNSRNNVEFPLNYYTYLADVLLVKSASFVSLLINSKVVKEVGLPIKEFFIWGDDLEYTTRIFNKGYLCLYADKSIVLHKTEANYVSDIKTAPSSAAWKFYYGFRNAVFLRRAKKKNIVVFFFYALNAYRRNKRKLKKRQEEEGKKAFAKALKKAFWDSLSFHPQIEYLSDKDIYKP